MTHLAAMNIEDCLLEKFFCKILSLMDVSKRQVLGKYVSKNHSDGNLIVPKYNLRVQQDLDLIVDLHQEDSFFVDSIKEDPKSNNLQFFLNGNHAFKISLLTVQSSGRSYGANLLKEPNFQIIGLENFIETDCLSKYRWYLSSNVLKRLLRSEHNQINNMNSSSSKRFVNESNPQKVCVVGHRAKLEEFERTICVICRTEIRKLNGENNVNLSYNDYNQLRTKDVMIQDEEKFHDNQKISSIVNSCIIFDLLSTKLTNPVFLDLTENPTMFRNSSSRGGIFVLYTFARIASIIRKFDEFILENGITLPSIEEVDFSSLNDSAEKVILFNYILMFPILIKEILVDLLDYQKCAIHKLCIFLTQFSSVVSKYYRVTRILKFQTPALFPQMYARVYLLRAVLQVFQNGLHYLCIEPVSEM